MKPFRVTGFGVWSYGNYSALYFTSISLLPTRVKCGAELHEGGVFSYCAVGRAVENCC